MSFLEIGCGTGLFLNYLQSKGTREFLGIDQDTNLERIIADDISAHFKVADVWQYLENGADGKTFDRIVLLDVFEHFTVDEGLNLLNALKRIMTPKGAILLRMPNGSSPWGLQYQHGDLTHRTTYTPGSIRQLAIAAGYRCTQCHGQKMGSPVRRYFDPLVHGIIGRLLMTPPEIWSANFYAILEPDVSSED
jgi:cyclopropane fatty-acyl-phospholipid synthase-like methyltransferase